MATRPSSAAFVNFIASKDGRPNYDYKKLSQLYDSTAVDYADYKCGHFRSPEVIVQQEISPDEIKIAEEAVRGKVYTENHKRYDMNLAEKLIRLAETKIGIRFETANSAVDELQKRGEIKRIAVHDDSTGIRESYMTTDTEEFFTI